MHADPFEPYPAARVGPLWFTGVGAGPHAAILLVPGFPTKVPIAVVEGPLEHSITLEGERCGGGEPLRFRYRGLSWYAEKPPFPVPMSRASMHGVGDRTGRLRAGPESWAFPGYMLFSAPGLWQIKVKKGKALVGTLVVKVVSGSERVTEHAEPVSMMGTPAVALRTCQGSAILRPACPLRIPRMAKVSAFALDGERAIFNLERSGEDPVHPRRNRPPRMLHIFLFLDDTEDGAVPFAHPTSGSTRPTNGLVRLGRIDPVFLGQVQWGGKAGTLALAPPYLYGGMAGNHLIFRWRQNGRSYALSLHAWEPFLETVATLRAIIESIPR
ncbi:MAG: hypothetical protein ACRDON_12625 [Gaiellaceae bacterium]